MEQLEQRFVCGLLTYENDLIVNKALDLLQVVQARLFNVGPIVVVIERRRVRAGHGGILMLASTPSTTSTVSYLPTFLNRHELHNDIVFGSGKKNSYRMQSTLL